MAKNEKIAIQINAEDNASKLIDKLAKRIDGLEADEARLVISAQTDKLEKQLERARRELAQLDGDEASVQLRAIGNLEEDLAESRRLFEQLDGQSGTVKLDLVGDAPTKIKEIEKSSDGAKSALANVVGNSAQDLSNLGGVAGTAGVAIGQIGEYAADASLAGEGLSKVIGNFARILGPVALLTAGVQVLTKVWGDYKKEQKKAAEEAARMLSIQRQLAEEEWAAAAASFVEEFGDKLSDAADQGIGVGDAIAYITGQTDKLDLPGALTFDTARAIGDIEKMREQFLGSGTDLFLLEAQTGEVEAGLRRAFGGPKSDIDELKGAVEETTEEVSILDEYLEGLGKASTILDVEQQFDDLAQAAFDAYVAAVEGSDDAEQKQRDYQREILATKETLAEYASEVLGLPEEQVVEILTDYPEETPEQIKARFDAAAGERTITFRSVFTGSPPIAKGVYAPGLNYDGTNDRDGNPATLGGRSAGGVNVVVNLPRAAEGRDVTAAIDKWARVDGRS